MKVDRELVLHIATLARIELSESEVETFTAQLGTILQYIEKLNEVQESAESFSFSEFLQHSLRPDEPRPSLSVEEALKNAPDRKNNFFRVPRIIP